MLSGIGSVIGECGRSYVGGSRWDGCFRAVGWTSWLGRLDLVGRRSPAFLIYRPGCIGWLVPCLRDAGGENY